MLEAILGGLIGAALGALLYRLGFEAARRMPRGGATAVTTGRADAADAAGGMTAALSPQELYNFLHYDGGEMPRRADEAKKGGV